MPDMQDDNNRKVYHAYLEEINHRFLDPEIMEPYLMLFQQQKKDSMKVYANFNSGRCLMLLKLFIKMGYATVILSLKMLFLLEALTI